MGLLLPVIPEKYQVFFYHSYSLSGPQIRAGYMEGMGKISFSQSCEGRQGYSGAFGRNLAG